LTPPIVTDADTYAVPPAPSWAAEIERSLRASRRVAHWVAAGAAVLVAFQTVALLQLSPLRRVAPYTLLVDRQTGLVETVGAVRRGPLAEGASSAPAFLTHYVLARENLDPAQRRDSERRVEAWSASAAAEQARAAMSGRQMTSADGNPFAAPPPVRVRSVELLTPTRARVRFDTVDPQGGAARRAYVATIGFRTGGPRRSEDGLLNPEGLQVTTYGLSTDTDPAASFGAFPSATLFNPPPPFLPLVAPPPSRPAAAPTFAPAQAQPLTAPPQAGPALAAPVPPPPPPPPPSQGEAGPRL
jgi:type IV secretory pathway component VirB8